MLRLENKYSKIALAGILIFTLLVIIKIHKWTDKRLIYQDTNYYYIYLPAVFIYHDIKLNYINEKLPPEIFGKSWYLLTPNNKRISKMSCGYAIMNLPFFLLAHAYETFIGGHADGYSLSYNLALCVSAFFFLVLALFYQRKILLYFFDDLTTAFTLPAIVLATNLFYYSTYSPGMTHVFSFFLFSAFVWQTIQFSLRPDYKKAIVLGLLLGLITIVRPTNIIIGLFPLLYAPAGKILVKEKILFLKKNRKIIFLFFISFIIGLLPQLIIWKIQTGSFICYSYQTEKFYFNHPHIIDGLFSFRNGLFIYCPVLFFVIPGFILMALGKQPYSIAVIVFFLVNCFVVFSWWCWWYGGSFGMRAMIESYAILSLPLGMFFFKLLKKFRRGKYVLGVLISFFILLYQFQNIQAQSTLLHYDSMTSRAYFKIFGRTTTPLGYRLLIEIPDYENAALGLPERKPYLRVYPFLKINSWQTMNIKAGNNKFISADRNLGGLVIANRDTPKEWEAFVLVRYETEKCVLISGDDKFVTADIDLEGRLIANRSDAKDWELFTYIPISENKFRLLGVRKKYVKTDATGLLIANGDQVSDSDIFTFININK